MPGPLPTPSQSSTCIDLKYDIKFGDRSFGDSYINVLQSFLAGRGYFQKDFVVTGYFGSLTLSAVKKFQADYGISSTGYVGPITRAKIKSISCSDDRYAE